MNLWSIITFQVIFASLDDLVDGNVEIHIVGMEAGRFP
jgi:hypothetical protein